MSSTQDFYHISGGKFAGHVICLWCGALLKNNLAYHSCLLYPDIDEWYIQTCCSLRFCPFATCSRVNYSIGEHVCHILNDHMTLILYTCDLCGVAYVSKTAVYLHKKSINFLCNSMDN